MPDEPVEARRIKSLVRSLPRAQRTIVMLFYADGLTPREIAEVLEIAQSKVQGVLAAFRAQAALRMGLSLAA